MSKRMLFINVVVYGLKNGIKRKIIFEFGEEFLKMSKNYMNVVYYDVKNGKINKMKKNEEVVEEFKNYVDEYEDINDGDFEEIKI